MDSGHQNDKAIQDNLDASASTAIHNISNVINSTVVCVSSLRELTESFTVENYVAAVQKLSDQLRKYPLTEEQQLLFKYFKSLGDFFIHSKKKAFQEIDALDKHIDHIKNIIQAQQGLQQNQSTECSVNTLIEEALQLSGVPSKNDGQIVIERDFQKLPTINLDKHKTIQILNNLIVNAQNALIESASPRKILKLTTKFDNDLIKICIKDNGIGIPPENLQKIFESGFTTRQSGHGIGLYSAASAAQELGGQITVHSEGLNRGSEFTLSIPSISKNKA